MGNIERIKRIKRAKLNGEYYFQSLLEQAYEIGMLSDAEIERIQLDCLSLLARQTELYNKGNSSSVRLETAQNILASIMFTIGVWLKTFPNSDDAVAEMQHSSMESLFQKGCRRIDQLMKSTKMLHSAILENLVYTENIFYSSTIVDGINGFFKLYNPFFSAQEIHITADYPVYNPTEKLAGIEFIQKYLECIYCENLFCSYFSEDDIHHLICGYDAHYKDLVINIYEPVLAAAIGCVLTETNIHRLDITPSSIKIINCLFERKAKHEITEILMEACNQLAQRMHLSNPLTQYIKCSLPQFAGSIKNAVHLQTLDKFFLVPAYPENNPKLIVSFGEKMDNEKYRKIVEEIMQCRYLSDKKAIIKREIHSLYDLEDVLLDAELSEEETISILRDLSLAEITALIKKHPLPSTLDRYELKQSEATLCRCLHELIALLPAEQQEMVKRAVAVGQCVICWE